MIKYSKICHENELVKVIHLGKKIWGFSEAESIPYHTLVTILHSGGVVFGAFLDEKLIGYSIATVALREEYALYLYMIGVSNKYTSKGIAQTLFKKNKDFANKKNIKSIYWSFNPLDASVASLYLNKLNAIVNQPMVYDMYGLDVDSLPTDRFIAQLSLSHNKSNILYNKSISKKTKIDNSLMNHSQFNQSKGTIYGDNKIAVEFPYSLNNLDMKEFIKIFRKLFTSYLKNYMVVDFISLKDKRKCYYILNRH